MKQWIKKKIYSSDLFLRILRDRSLFEFFQRKGFHVLENHFYNPVPDTSVLSESYFHQLKNMSAIDINEPEQLQHFRSYNSFKKEFSEFPLTKTTSPEEFYWDNGGFMCLDAVALYGMIRSMRPQMIFEIGGGNSTKLSARAVLENEKEGHACQLTCIEPYPNVVLKKGFRGLTNLIESTAQQVPISEFQKLQEGDFLFIDSSHVLKNGSDVEYYFSQVLPQLNRGVFIHFHDIFLPEEYPKEWIMNEHRFWNEQYLLHSFLSYNHAFKVVFAARNFQLHYVELVNQLFDFYPYPITKAGSFWMQKLK